MKWENIKGSPVFVGGHRKSGTTLFASLLDGHKELFVYPGETGFFYKFYPFFDSAKYSDLQKETRVINAILTDLNEVVRDWIGQGSCPGFSRDKLTDLFKKKIAASPKTTKDYFDAVISSAWELLSQKKDQERFWVEKTTSIEIYADTLFDWYPNAKFIHILRDPRDNYASIKSGWEKEYQRYFDSKERLLQSVIDRGFLGMKLADINLKRFGSEKYMILRYEDLVSDPNSVLEAVCKFIGIKFNKSLLTPTFCGVSWKGNNFESKSFDSISSGNLNRWKERISDHETKVLEFYFGDLMQRYGYAPSFTEQESADAARVHYKWFNYAQTYSLKIDPAKPA